MDLFTDQLAALRKRRANVSARLRVIHDHRRGSRIASGYRGQFDRERHQLQRTFWKLTEVEVDLCERIG